MSQDLGRLLIILGLALLVIGLLLTFGKGIPFLGRLPGDIRIQKDGFTFYFPLVTCLVLSFILTLLIRLFRR